MPFFGKESDLRSEEDIAEMAMQELQDWVDGLEANGIPVPVNVRAKLDHLNEMAAKFVSSQYRMAAGVPTQFEEELEDWQDRDDRRSVNEAYGIIMGERPVKDEDIVDISMGRTAKVNKIGPDGAKRRLRHSSSVKSDMPSRGWKKKRDK